MAQEVTAKRYLDCWTLFTAKARVEGRVSTMSVDNFKTNIYEYLETLPTITFLRLFEKPATCLAIFRYQSTLIDLQLTRKPQDYFQALEDRLLCRCCTWNRPCLYKMSTAGSIRMVNGRHFWTMFVGQLFVRKLTEALHKLSRLRILEHRENTLLMNATFRQEFKNALTGG